MWLVSAKALVEMLLLKSLWSHHSMTLMPIRIRSLERLLSMQSLGLTMVPHVPTEAPGLKEQQHMEQLDLL
jgi:hypothetical protein